MALNVSLHASLREKAEEDNSTEVYIANDEPYR
jgi:hypothetical protein